MTKQFYLQDYISALLLAVCSGLIIFGLTVAWPTSTYDAITHLQRTEALSNALRAGVVHPRWFPELMFGHGDPVLNYYAPGYYYPPALLHLAGLDLVLSTRMSLSIFFAISAYWMYGLSRLFVSFWPAVVSVICFQFFPYRIYDLFFRGAFPEFNAFTWLPLIAFCTIGAATAVNKPSKKSAFSTSLVKGGLAWTGLFLTHNLAALMAVFLLGAAFALYIALNRQTSRSYLRLLASGVFPMALGLLLAAWFILPALTELDWVLTGHGLFAGLNLSQLLPWRELVDFSISYPYIYPTLRPSLPTWFFPVTLGAIAALWFQQAPALRLLKLVVIPLTLFVTWMMTEASAWLWIQGGFLLQYINFPWRWQIFLALGMAVLLAATLETLRRAGRPPASAVPILCLLISIYLGAYTFVQLKYETDKGIPYREGPASTWDGWLRLISNSPWGKDFLPIWAAERISYAAEAGRKPWHPPQVFTPVGSAAIVPTSESHLHRQYLVTAEKTFRLLFHQFYFPPWQITLDGVLVDSKPSTGLAIAGVEIPPGTHELEIAWKATSSVWLGRILTTAGWLVVLILLSHAAKVMDLPRRASGNFRRTILLVWPPVAWLVVGTLMGVAISGITVRTYDVAAIGADYGNIRLEGLRSVQPVRAGEVAKLHLIWAVTGPGSPVSAFVHLVDEDGYGISQHDGPPGGVHTPFERWTPGLILESKHNVTIPDSLPPGNYRVVAGLYFPDISHEPLMPLNGNSARLDIWKLKVLP
ncbi:MAG: hypothetical protein OXF62_07140 [Caldilineaceae bacterium]|nr:hypothetical protein [Caldilineaceae bacterium]